MKVLFLDIDGVLNSEQEVIWRHRMTKGKEHIPGSYRLYRILAKLFPSREWTSLWLYYGTGHCKLCPIACSNLQYILDEDPEVRIVISSTWRSTWGVKWMKKILARNGVDASKVIGRTGAWEDGGKERGDQIMSWLNRHMDDNWTVPETGLCKPVDLARREPLTHFVVLDDDSDMSAVRDNFIQTNGQLGLTILDARDALRVLGNVAEGKTLFSIGDE